MDIACGLAAPQQLAALALRHAVPAIYAFREFYWPAA
jgi:hypothetical protein